MRESSPSLLDRLRAATAASLARLAAAAHRVEEWSARGTRPVVLGVIAVAILAVGIIGVMYGGRAVAAWTHDGPRAHSVHAAPGPKPDGRPEGRPIGKPDGRPIGKPEVRPDAP
jgi:hypothetical protein